MYVVTASAPPPPSVDQGKLDKHLCRAERKYSLAEKKLQEQKKKERQNKVRRSSGTTSSDADGTGASSLPTGASSLPVFEVWICSLCFFPLAAATQKCMDDCEQSLAVLTDEIGAKVNQFISRLQGCSHTHWNISGSVIKKNISRICQDQARLQEVCRGIESLMQENDPFSFIEVRGVHAALLPFTCSR